MDLKTKVNEALEAKRKVPKVNLTLYLDPNIEDMLDEIAEEHDVVRSAVVEELIKFYYEENFHET